MPAQMMHISGLKDLDKALEEFADEYSPRKAKNILLGALKDGGKLIAAAGEANAPRGPTGQLAESYTVTTKLTRRQRSRNRKESDVEVYVGPTPHPKSVQTEFGNAHQPAHPHLRPAWDSQAHAALNVFVERIKERLEKTRARLARKAEREAAKLKAGV